jgi:hypothetical protein
MPLRKSTMLALVDEGGRVVRAHARILVLGAGFLLLPVTLLELVASRTVADAEGGIGAVLPSLSAVAGSDVAADGYWIAGVLAVISTSLLTAMIGALSAHVVIRVRTGEPVNIWMALAATGRRFPTIFLAWLIGHVWAIAAVIFLGGAAGLAVFIAMVGAIVTVLTLYVSPVIMIEGLGPFAALKRARKLVKGSFGDLAVFALLTGFLGLWLRASLSLLPTLAESTGLITFGGLGWLAEGVGGQLALLISSPIVATATTLSYLDTRVRREALDIVSLLPETFDAR